MCVCKCESVVNLAIHMCVQGESGRWEARGERPQRHEQLIHSDNFCHFCLYLCHTHLTLSLISSSAGTFHDWLNIFQGKVSENTKSIRYYRSNV